MKKARIIRQAPNEFIFEFETKADAKRLAEGTKFEHEGVRYKVVRRYPGFPGPAVYSFLVIADILNK